MKRFLVSAIILAAIIILPAPIWLYLTHKSSYPIASDKNLLFIGDSRIKYSIDDAALSRCVNHSFSGETPFGAYITLRALLSYEDNNIDTVVLSMWSHILNSDESNLAKANRGFDKRMQYVTIDDIVDAGMSIKDLIEPTITTMLYSRDNPHGGFEADNKQSLSESIERSEAVIANDGGELVTYKLYKKGVSYDGLCKIQELCKQKGKTLILLTTPSYRGDRYQDHDHFKQNLRDSLGGSGLIYVDFDNFPLPDSCYKDALHTNRHGAKIFSEHINKYGLLYGAAEVIRLE